MKLTTFGKESTRKQFKRFVVSATDHSDAMRSSEIHNMVDVIDSMPLVYGQDYVVAGVSIYFDTDECRTMFLLKCGYEQ